MKQRHDLGGLEWTVAGYVPTSWTGRSMELGFALEPEVAPVPAHVPGSVQGALRTAGVIPDWNVGFNSRDCEWVENREWMYTVRLPDAWFKSGRRFVLRCGGLDGPGLVVFNTRRVGSFDNAFVPHTFDLTPHIRETGNELHLVFCLPPRWLGQVGYTSQMKDWKPRFNYTWDWMPRLVQVGPWEPVTLEITDTVELGAVRCRTDWDVAAGTGTLWAGGTVQPEPAEGCRVRLTLRQAESVVASLDLTPAQWAAGTEWRGLKVRPWWPNGAGERALYTVAVELLDAAGNGVDVEARTVGFKHIDWQACAGAPAGADPWICVVNGTPVFLQGIDWTPIRPTFADLTREDYRRLIEQYRDLGMNSFRVWGGAYLEKSWFYDLCDEQGLLVWQEFPLSSSGHENWPHEDEPSMRVLEQVAASYIARRQHHASLLMWCGGNELQGDLQGNKTGTGRPVDLTHPLMQRWKALVDREDPGRRFVPTSSSGPRFYANESDFGKGLHWDVHGPWKGPGATPADWARYWENDDALFRSETGAPGTSSADLIRRYAGGLSAVPGTLANPLWRRFAWWIEWGEFAREHGREPAGLDEYVAWSQARQATALGLAVRACKRRFPGIGGVILWMGHDAFPCLANTSIVDFEGNLKPAARVVGDVFRGASAHTGSQSVCP